MYDAYNKRLLAQLSEEIVTKRNTKYSLRGSNKIVVPRFYSHFLKQSISYRGAVLWNTFTFEHLGVTQVK